MICLSLDFEIFIFIPLNLEIVLLGYNYNSSEWYERSYKILNSDYKPPKITKDNEDESLVKRTLKKIIGLDE